MWHPSAHFKKNNGKASVFFSSNHVAPCFWQIFEKPNQPSQQLSLWMKQSTFHYSKFVVNSNALKTDKIPNFANLSAPNSETNHPSTTKKGDPCATRKPQLLPKVQQTTLHPCTKGTSMRHNVVASKPPSHPISFWWKK